MGAESLYGKKIKAIVNMPELAKEFGWDHTPTVIVLDDGTLLFASRDEEGNDSGELYFKQKDGNIFMLS
jgi:hypothetical protein